MAVTVGDVFRAIRTRPGQILIRRWNWKSACVSAIIHASIYFGTNLRAGWRPAVAAMLVEAVYRVPLAGLCGAFTQAFTGATPAWAATLTVMVGVPLASHTIEFLVHLVQGTPKLFAGLAGSVCFTAISSLFNLYAMRHGVLLVGREGRDVGSDIHRMPGIIAGFLAAGPLALYRGLRSRLAFAPEQKADLDEQYDHDHEL